MGLKWAYCVTTVPARRGNVLNRTLNSLRAAGFGEPTVFVDGLACSEQPAWEKELGLGVVPRGPSPLGAMKSWGLALAETYLRNPFADRFAVFQDDLVAYRNLRSYLDWSLSPGGPGAGLKGYLNLFTFTNHYKACPRYGPSEHVGWYNGTCLGWGAVALVFDYDALIQMLSNRQFFLEKPRAASVNRDKAIDGSTASALTDRYEGPAGWKEWVHNPSLVQHVGNVSTVGHQPFNPSPNFRGEHFDATQLAEPVRRSVQAGGVSYGKAVHGRCRIS